MNGGLQEIMGANTAFETPLPTELCVDLRVNRGFYTRFYEKRLRYLKFDYFRRLAEKSDQNLLKGGAFCGVYRL